MEEFRTILDRCHRLLLMEPELMDVHPNERLFRYWKYYNGFGDVTLVARELDNYHSVDRAFRRIMPPETKNYKKAEEYRQELKNETN